MFLAALDLVSWKSCVRWGISESQPLLKYSPLLERHMTALALSKPPSWQINVAAEGIAAAQFARCGFDVSVQYGADKPKYDLVVAKGEKLLKISVKGSQDGCWNIAQPFLKRATELSGTKADYHGAIELWIDHHGSRTVCCFVQFESVAIDQLPRIYLASPREIALRLRGAANGRGDTILYEECEWVYPGEESGTLEKLPKGWLFSHERIEELLALQQAVPLGRAPLQRLASSTLAWPTSERIPIRDQANLTLSA